MNKITDKLCDLIVKGARIINALIPVICGLAAAYFIGMFIVALILR
jgi:hypothetical protein